MSSQATLKERVEKALKKSLFCVNNKEIFLHPAVIGDCVKSLIGSNLNDPYLKLVDWLENEIEKLDKKEDYITSKTSEIKTTSYKQLQEALINKDKELVVDILTRLQSLTDGTQLIEFLIEMSLHQTGRSFISAWRIYKIVNFAKIEDRLSCYQLMCDIILSDKFREDSFKSQKIKPKMCRYISSNYLNTIVYAHILDCQNHSFIRQENLSMALNKMISYIGNENQSKSELEIHEDSIKKDRSSVLHRIKKDELKISKKNILLLDSIRMLIKNAPTINDNFVNYMYEKLEDN